mgnify:CR=1 FL=1
MAFTYNSTNIGSSGLATVRFHSGETSSGTAILTDAEINAVLDNITANYYLAAAICCDNLAAHYASQADTRNEGLEVAASQRSKAYERRAVALRSRANYGATIFAGGRSKQTKEDRAADTDLVQPSFTKDMHDFPASVDSSTDD